MIKTPWNKDKSAGQKKGFTQLEIRLLQEKLANECLTLELTLFTLGIKTNLKSNSLIRLKVLDVARSEENFKIARDLIVKENKKDEDYLFSYKRGKHISRAYYAKLVKKWAVMLELDPGEYSTMSVVNGKRGEGK